MGWSVASWMKVGRQANKSRRLWHAAVAVSLAAAAACGSSERELAGERAGKARQALTTNERVLGCENAADWSASTPGTSLSTSSNHVEGAASLGVASPATGGTYLTSIPLSSLGSDVGDNVTVDVRYPNPAPNPYWFGELGVVLVSPSLQLWWENLGTQNLQGATPAQFARFSFPIGSELRDKLRGSYSDLQVKVFLNVPSAPGPWLVDRISFGTGGGGTGGTAGTGGSGGSSAGGNAAILGFEATDLWSTTGGTLVAHSTRVEGNFSLELSNVNQSFTELTSDPLSTVGPVASVIGFDLSVPNPEGDIWWWGSAAITVDCPSKGLNNRWIGQQELDGSALDRFRRIEALLPDDVRAALQQGPYADLRIKIALTVPPGSGPYLFDRFTFAPQMPEPAPPAPSATVDRALGFETLEAWKASAANIQLSSDAAIGASAIAISNFGYTELTSQRLSSLGTGLRNRVTVDIKIPEPPAGAGWTGSIGLAIDLPSHGLNNVFIGQVDLQPFIKGTWTRAGFDIPSLLQAKLPLNYSDLRVKLLLNRPIQVGAWIVDKIDFGQLLATDPLPPFAEEYVIPLPKGSTFADVAVGHALVKFPKFARGGEQIRIEEGARVTVTFNTFADVIAPRGGLGSDPSVLLMPGADTGDVSAFIGINNLGTIHGDARSGVIYLGAGQVTGIQDDDVDLASFEAGRISVAFPSGNFRPDVLQEEGDPTVSVDPGVYDLVEIDGSATFRSGSYHINRLTVGGNLLLDNAQGPVFLFVRSGLNVDGSVRRQDTSKWNVLFVVAGTEVVSVDPDTGPSGNVVEGTIVAPRAHIAIEEGEGIDIIGSYFGRAVTVEGGLTHRPFVRDDCGASSCGVFGCDTADRDADGLFDCDEENDDDSFTDPDAFNGLRATAIAPCGGAPTCTAIDSQTELNACRATSSVVEERDLYAGWNLGGEALTLLGCRSEVDFWPPWKGCHETDVSPQTIDFSGRIKLAQSGRHCFDLQRTSENLCGALFFDNAEAGQTSADGVQCFDADAGIYPVRLFLHSGAAPDDRFKLAYCFGGASNCTPADAISQEKLRPEFGPSGPCETNGDCRSDQFCAANGSCRDDGAACTVDAECLPDEACIDQVCRPPHCEPNCDGRVCGDQNDDGCGGTCPGLCDDGEFGCNSDWDCQIGSSCRTDLRICWKQRCNDFDPHVPGGGVGDVECPNTFICEPKTSPECGFDDCNEDHGDCPGGQECNADGLCVEQPNPSAEHDPDFPDPLPPDPTIDVGTLFGRFSVSNRGTASYSIPLTLPPARQDFVPQLALVYGGTKDDGMMGRGWRVAGFSAVSRCASTISAHGVAAPPVHRDTDRFCLDGAQLVPAQPDVADPDADGTEYRTEIDTFSKIVLRGPTHDGISYVGPQRWEVFTKDGRVLTYGASDNASLKTRRGVKRVWALEKARDRAGNLIEYRYKTHQVRFDVVQEEAEGGGAVDTGELIPDTVLYGGHEAGIRANQWVKFEYEDRPAEDQKFHFVHGARGFSLRRLEHLATFVGGQEVRRYVIGYPTDEPESRVESVSECVNNGTLCKPATTFDYEPFVPYQASNRDILGVGPSDEVLALFDQNGDGLSDHLVRRPDGAIKVIITRRDADGTLSGQALDVPWSSQTKPDLVADMDGNGQDDIVDPQGSLLLSDSDAGASLFFVETFPAPPGAPLSAALADFDGDARPDLVTCLGDRLAFFRNTSGGLLEDPVVLVSGEAGFQTCDRLLTIDSDGDGTDELLLFKYGTGEHVQMVKVGMTDRTIDVIAAVPIAIKPTQYSEIKVMDFNGDGLRDVLELRDVGGDPQRAFALWENTGAGFVLRGIAASLVDGFPSDEQAFTWNDKQQIRKAAVFDYDGDGRDDLVSRGFGQILVYSPKLRFELVVSTLGPPGLSSPRVGDVNGDGNLDVSANESGIGVHGQLLLGSAAKRGLLGSVVDGLGKRIDISYNFQTPTIFEGELLRTHSPVAGNCTSPSSMPCLSQLPPLVSEHVESIAGGEQRGPRHVYFYHLARKNFDGWGFAGFESRDIVVLDDHDNLHTRTNLLFFLHPVLNGLVNIARTTHAAVPGNTLANLESHVTTIRNDFGIGTSAAGRPFPQLFHWSRQERDIGSGGSGQQIMTTQADLATNSFGDVESQVIETFGGVGTPALERTEIDTDFYPNDIASWRISLPEDVTVTSTRGGTTVERHIHLDFYEDGLLENVWREQDDAYLSLKTHLGRDDYGNVKSVTTSDAQGTARTTEILEFDSRFTFPLKIENAEDHVFEVDFDPRTGQIRTLADPNRIFTRYGYDGFGRMTREELPDDETIIQYRHASPSTSTYLGAIRSVMETERVQASGGGIIRRVDGFGRAVGVESTGFEGVPVLREFAYDWAHRLSAETSPHIEGEEASQGVTSYVYDPRGRLSRIVLPDLSFAEYLHASTASVKADYESLLTGADALYLRTLVKPRSNVEARVLDHNGAPVAALEAEGVAPAQMAAARISRMTYGPFGELYEIRDPLQNLTRLVPDRWGRVEDVFDPNSGHEHRVFSAWGEPVQVTDAKNETRTLQYDLLGRLRTLLNADAEVIAEWIYDGSAQDNEVGRLIAAHRQSEPGSSLSNSILYSYEPPVPGLGNTGRLRRIQRNIPGESGLFHIFATELDYDADGRLETLTYPDAPGSEAGSPRQPFQVRNQYDDASGMLMAVHGVQSEVTYWQMLSASQGFRLEHERFGNGVESTRQYYSLGDPHPACSANGQLACVPGTLRAIQAGRAADPGGILNLEYEWNKNGSLASRSRADGSGEDAFLYDPFDQLSAHSRIENGIATPVASYTYDELGNLTSRTGVGTYEYAGSGRPNAVDHIGATTFHYDDNGNQDEREGPLAPLGYQKLDYNDFNMPWQITTGTGPSEFVTHLEYDAFERRIAKRLPGEETIYAGDLYEHVTTAEGIEHRYKIFAGDSQVAQITKTEVGGVTVGAERMRLIHDDHLGSVTAITGDTEADTEVRTFGPFGEQTVDFSATGVRSGFTGHEHDAELGIINMRGRLYDSAIGKFLQPDPFVTTLSPGGLNPYAYVMNNPTTFTDPSGFFRDIFKIDARGGSSSGGLGVQVDTNGDGVPDEPAGGSTGGGSSDVLDLTRSGIMYQGGVSIVGGSDSSGGSTGSGAPPPDVTETVGPGPGGGITERGGPARTPDPGAGAGLGAPGGVGSNPNAPVGPGKLPGRGGFIGEEPDYEGMDSDDIAMCSRGFCPGDPFRLTPAGGWWYEAVDLVAAGVAAAWDWLTSDDVVPPQMPYPGSDPTKPPQPGWQWRGSGPPGSNKGNWVNPSNPKEWLHPDLNHPAPIGPHWDWNIPGLGQFRIFPDGRVLPK